MTKTSLPSGPKGPDISIIIPCYNEERLLEPGVRQIEAVMDTAIYRYELVFVDDASTDGTTSVIEKLCAERPGRQYIRHYANCGRGQTVMDGLVAAKGRVAGFVDIDMEVHARYIPGLARLIDQEGFQTASVSRVYRFSPHPRDLTRTVLSLGYRYLVYLTLRLPARDTESGFKFFERNSILPLLARVKESGWFWDTEIMALAHRFGLRMIEVPGVFERRHDKRSSVRLVHDVVGYLIALARFRTRLPE